MQGCPSGHPFLVYRMIERSNEYKKMGELLIKKVPELQWIKECKIKIAYLESTQKKTKGKKTVYADCRKVEEWVQVFCKYDFVITVYVDNCMGMTKNQMELLMWHELLHIGIEDGTLNPIYIVNPHDVEDFRSIIDRFGIGWAEPGAEIPSIWDVLEDEQRELKEGEGNTIQKWRETGEYFTKRRNSIRHIETQSKDDA